MVQGSRRALSAARHPGHCGLSPGELPYDFTLGLFVSPELKRPGRNPVGSDIQEHTIEQIADAGGLAFVENDADKILKTVLHHRNKVQRYFNSHCKL